MQITTAAITTRQDGNVYNVFQARPFSRSVFVSHGWLEALPSVVNQERMVELFCLMLQVIASSC